MKTQKYNIYFEYFAKDTNNYPIGKPFFFKTAERNAESIKSELLNLNYQETKRRFFAKIIK